jgi:phage baseplate assembly protein W
MSKPRKKRRSPKRVLALPDLEQSKAAVLNSLTSKSSQSSYDCTITDFVDCTVQNRASHSTAL